MAYVAFLRAARALRAIGIAVAIMIVIGVALHYATKSKSHSFIENAQSGTLMHRITHGDIVEEQRMDDGKPVDIVFRENATIHAYVITSGNRSWYHGEDGVRRLNRLEHDHANNVGLWTNEHQGSEGTSVTSVVVGTALPLEAPLIGGGFFALILASVLGFGLSKENDGHLEVAWTRPSSRVRSALVMYAVDIVALITCIIVVAFAMIASVRIVMGDVVVRTDEHTPFYMAISLLTPLAWYGLTQGLTASMPRLGGAVAGALWAVALTLPSVIRYVTFIPLHVLLKTINSVNPLIYGYHFSVAGPMGGDITYIPAGQTYSIITLLLIFLIAASLAVVQWRRVEA